MTNLAATTRWYTHLYLYICPSRIPLPRLLCIVCHVRRIHTSIVAADTAPLYRRLIRRRIAAP